MTAAVINPTSTVTGTLDAGSCNIGVYIDSVDAKIDTADISGANYFGVVVNGDSGSPSASISNSNIHDIGETPLNDTQHGVGIYFRSFFVTGSASGTISNNSFTRYQKGGIVANGQGVNVAITDNIVTGQGRVDYIAQNGIQVGYGASASVMRNTVIGNAYTGTNGASSAGILVVGGPFFGTGPDGSPLPFTVNTRIIQNTVRESDVGVWLANLNADLSPPTSATNIKVVNNVLSNLLVTNMSGAAVQAVTRLAYRTRETTTRSSATRFPEPGTLTTTVGAAAPLASTQPLPLGQKFTPTQSPPEWLHPGRAL
jgi:hypothetical protein